MLCKVFDSLKEAHGEDYFILRVEKDVIENLNPKFSLRDYQLEAIGRFDFYIKEYRHRRIPVHLLFNMATGSGKTIIMAANILQLYKLGYRNFIFFVNSVNILEKTKDNFLNIFSEKYLFAPKLKINNKEVLIKEVNNFESVNDNDINILFTTIQGLHIRLTQPRENSITEEDFTIREIVLISDEAHHIQKLTRDNSSNNDPERTWEYTVIEKILKANPKNYLLEFTATIDLSDENILNKYSDKIIFQYDLKQFRLDKYSKEIEVVQADLEPKQRMIQAIILNQYKRKIAQKNGINLKPVILFKSKTIRESKENFNLFLEALRSLSFKEIIAIKNSSNKTELEKVFKYLEKNNIEYDNFINELKYEFSEQKIMLLDSENISSDKQLLLNSLESKTNEIRAIFAVNMLNEGWDVLNLFDIVRLYDTRDGKWDRRGNYIPGSTTISEAQLIGRGARYFPFTLNDLDDPYKRKFDDDIENELRAIETLHYHCKHNPRYIEEIKRTLTEIGLLPEKAVVYDLFIKPEIKNKVIWRRGKIFKNDRLINNREDIFSFNDAKIEKNYKYEFPSGIISTQIILDNETHNSTPINIETKKIKLLELGENVVRAALDKLDFYKFDNLKKFFPHLNSIKDFINNENYLSQISIELKGPEIRLNQLSQKDKINIALNILEEIAIQSQSIKSDYKGSLEFKPYDIGFIIRDKRVKYTPSINTVVDSIDVQNLDWFAQKEFRGTSEEKNLIEFLSKFINILKKKYNDVLLIRNERFVQIYDFDEGRPFEPDFILLLREVRKKSRSKNSKILTYQVFIEPKGDQFKDSSGGFDNSVEGWKQKFLSQIEKKAKILFEFKDSEYRLIGLPFYNKNLENDFEKAFKEKINI